MTVRSLDQTLEGGFLILSDDCYPRSSLALGPENTRSERIFPGSKA